MGDLKQNQPPQHEAAGRIADILLHFGDRFYSETSDSPQFTLRDILTDLRHYADVYGLDFSAALEGSGEVYREETKAEPPEEGTKPFLCEWKTETQCRATVYAEDRDAAYDLVRNGDVPRPEKTDGASNVIADSIEITDQW